MVWPATKLRLEVVGLVTPSGHTVAKPAAVGWVTVTLMATAPTPLAGTPPLPVTCTLMVPLAGTGPVAPVPLRVSRMRDGVRGDRPPAAGVPDANQPKTSPTYCAVPVPPLNRSILPSAPTGTTTRLGMVWPATKLRLEVVGFVTPSGHTVAKPAAVGWVTVTL